MEPDHGADRLPRRRPRAADRAHPVRFIVAVDPELARGCSATRRTRSSSTTRRSSASCPVSRPVVPFAEGMRALARLVRGRPGAQGRRRGAGRAARPDRRGVRGRAPRPQLGVEDLAAAIDSRDARRERPCGESSRFDISDLNLYSKKTLGYRTASIGLTRDVNRSAVLRVIGAAGPIARTTIAAQLGLSPATVTAVTRELIDQGLVRVARSVPSKGGRPALLLELVGGAASSFGVKIAADHLVGVRVDLEAELLERFETDFDAATRERSTPSARSLQVGWRVLRPRRRCSAWALACRGCSIGRVESSTHRFSAGAESPSSSC